MRDRCRRARVGSLAALAAGWLAAGSLAGVAQPARSPADTAARSSAGALPIALADDQAQEAALRMEAFLARLRPDALAAGVGAETYDRAVAGLLPDASIPPLLNRQPEHEVPPWDYLDRLVSESRIANGRDMLAKHADVLDAIAVRHGVDRHVVAAIWGVETSYGALPGTRPVVRSLATLAVADVRRAAFWRAELMAALQILERGDVTAERMTGSWAGAMGHTQFMPSSYLAHAVDHDGDGRRDIWASVPDALASAAAYLRRSGWKAGETWGFEVLLPAAFDYSLADPRQPRELESWRALGLERPGGQPWPARLSGASLLLPAGRHGPAFLVTGNFRAILRYNNAAAYALAVGHLADRLAGQGPLTAAWPTDDPPLDRAGRFELQERLAAQGLDVGGIDGVVGGATRSAVRAWQRRRGLAEDGWAGRNLLGLLREAPAPATLSR